MTPRLVNVQAVDEIYELLRLAAARRQPVAAIYDGQPRLLCPHVLGRKSGRLHVFCYQFGGSSDSGLAVGARGAGGWRCLAVEKLSQVELSAGHGTPSHDAAARLALMKSISTPTLSAEEDPQ